MVVIVLSTNIRVGRELFRTAAPPLAEGQEAGLVQVARRSSCFVKNMHQLNVDCFTRFDGVTSSGSRQPTVRLYL